jgi:hypothetical protein
MLIVASLAASITPSVAIGHDTPRPQIGFVVGASDVPGMFLNWIHSAGGLQGRFNPADFDANGNPNIASPTDTAYNAIYALPSLAQYRGTWEYGFSGTGARRIQGVDINIVSDPRHCYRNSGYIEGTNCDVVFSWRANPPSPVTLQWLAGAAYSGMNNEFLIRSSDKAAFQAGQILTPEFISILHGANPLFVRTLGLTFPNQHDQNCGSWKYRTPATANSWTGGSWFPSLWSGSITGTDHYIAVAARDTPPTWTDQEMLQGTLPNASNPAIKISHAASDDGLVQLTVNSTATLTTNQQVLVMNAVYQTFGQNLEAPHIYTIKVVDGTHLDLNGTSYSPEWNNAGLVVTTTIDIAGRGPKFMVATGGMAAPNVAASASGTLFYDAPLNLVLYSPGPEMCGMPFEEQAELANEIGGSLWQNIPQLFRPADVTALTAYYAAHLLSDLYLELANENWNPIFTSYQYFYQRGYKIGLVLSGNEANYGAVGLISRQLFAAAQTAWTRPRSSLMLISAVQVNGGSPNLYEKYQFSGSVLCGASCGNPAYQSAVGIDYNRSPNRPKDYMDAYSGASYFSGSEQNGDSGTLAQLSGLINAGTEFASGDRKDALDFIDTDNRAGECGGCPAAIYTIAYGQTSIFPGWNTVAANDDKNFIAYEGGYSSFGPTATYLTRLGDAHAEADATNINNLEIAYRSSPQFFDTYIYQNKVLFSFSQVVGNSQLQVRGSTIPPGRQAWFVLQGGYFDLKPYQNYYALQAINLKAP